MTAINRDFVVKNGLQVSSNLVVGAYTGPSASQIANGAVISGNVGIGTSAVPAGSRLSVSSGNITITSLGTGLVFPDGSFQYEAAQSYGPQYTLQFAGAGNTFSGDSSNLSWSPADTRLLVNNLSVTSNTAALGANTGALQISGGASIVGNLFVGGGINISGNINVTNVSGIQDLTVNSLTSNTFVRAGTLLSGAIINSDSSVTAATTLQANQILANVNVGIGTATIGYPLDIYGNIHIGNTATTTSGILFPDGTFQDTAAFYTPSFGTPGTIQFAGTNNVFSGDATNFTWDTNSHLLHASNIAVVGNAAINSVNANALAVAGDAVIGGNLSVTGSISFANLEIGSNIVAQSLTSNSTIQSLGNAVVNGLYSNTFVQVANLMLANSIISNSTVTTPSLTVNNTATIGYANVVTSAQIANNLVIGGNLTVTGTFQFGNVGVAQDVTVNSLTSNTTIQAAGTATVNALYSNTSVQAAGTATVNSLISNVYGVFGQNVTINSTNASISTATGALVIAGGVGMGGNLFVGGNITTTGTSGNISGVNTLFAAKIGVGTGSPTQPLTVYGNVYARGNTHVVYGRLGIGTSNIKVGDNLTVVGGNINVATFGTGIFFPDGSFQQSSAGTSAAGPDRSVQYNDGGRFAGQSNFVFDKLNNRLGIGTASLTNSLTVFSASPALFNTTNGSDQQIIVGNASSDGAVVGFNSGASTAYGYLQYAGSVLTNITFTKQGTGINGVTIPINALDVGGGTAIGFAYAGVQTAPSDGLIAVGRVGIGTFAPGSALDVMTNASIRGRFSVANEAEIGTLVVNTSMATSTLNVSGQLQAGSLISNTSIQVDGVAYVNSLISNTTIQSIGVATLNEIVANTNTTTNTLNARGLATVNDLISNTNTTSTFLNIKTLAQVFALVSNNNIYGATLNVGGLAQLNSLVSNTTIQSIGTATVNALISNTNTTTATLNTTGVALVNSLISNNNVYGATVQSGGTATVNALLSNTNITSQTVNSSSTLWAGNVYSNGFVQAAGLVTVNQLISNNNVYGATLQSSGTALVNELISNTNITTATLNSTGQAQVNSLISNNNIYGATLNTSGLITAASMISNSSIQAAGTATVNALIGNNNVYGATLQSGGTGLVNALISNNNIYGSTYNGGDAVFQSVTSNGNVQSAGSVIANTMYSNLGIVVTSGGIQVSGTSSITGNFNVTGNITVAGNVFNVQSNVISLEGPTIAVGGSNVGTLLSDDGLDRGVLVHFYSNIPNNAFFGRQDSSGNFVYITNVGPGTQNVNNPFEQYTGYYYGTGVFGDLVSANTTISTSSTTGALRIGGGAGIGGNININGQQSNIAGNLLITGSNASTLSTNGALVITNGLGVGGNINSGGNLVTLGAIVGGGQLVAANIYSNGFVQAAGAVVAQSITSNSSIQAAGTATVNALIANNNVFGATLQSNGTATVANLVSNGYITGANITTSGAGLFLSVTSNTTIQAAGTATVNALIANNNVYGATLNTAGLAQVNSLISNTNITTATLNSTGAAEVNSLISNTTIQAIGTATVNALISNNNVFGATLNTSGLAQHASLISNNNITSATLNTIGQAQVNSLIANANIQGANLNITGTAFAGNVYSNGFVQAAGLVTVNQLIGNTNVYGGNLQTSGLATVNALVSNTYITAANINITSAVVASSITSNSYIQAGTYALVNSLTSNAYGVFGQNLTVNSSNASTASNNGALVLVGGAGIGGNLNVAGQLNYFSGNLVLAGTNVSTSSSTGALIVTNGVGIGGNLYVAGNVVVSSNITSQGQQNTFGGNLLIAGSNASISSSTGALTVTGGAGVGGNLNVGGSRNLFTNSLGIGTSTSTGINSNVLTVYGTETVYGNIVMQNSSGQSGIYFSDGSYLITAGGGGSYSNANVANYLSGPVVIGNLTIANTTASTSSTTGALLMGGGAGIQGNVNISGNLNVANAASFSFVSASSSIVAASLTSNTTIQAAGTATINALYSNTSVQAAGTATVNSLISNVYGVFGQNVTINSTNASISTATGALVIAGGVGMGGNLFVGGNITTTGTSGNISGVNTLFAAKIGVGTTSSLGIANAFAVYGTGMVYGNVVLQNTAGQSGIYFADGSYLISAGGGGSYSNANVISYLSGPVQVGNLYVLNSTASTSSVTGALITNGGAGIGGNLNIATGTTSTFSGNVGIGTASALGATSNVMTVYGTENLYGNLRISNTTAGISGIYFADGTFMNTAASGGGGGGSTPGGSNTNIQYNINGALGGSNGLVFFGNTTQMGIGTSHPNYTLDVYGNIHIGNNATGGSNGIIFADGSVQTSAANASVQTFTFTATAGQTTFSVFPYTPGPQGVNLTQVFVNGVYQRTSTYAWVGTNIVLTVGAVQYARVEIRISVPGTSLAYIGSQIAGSNVFNVQTSGVTVWNTGFNYTVGYLDLYLNGIKLVSGTDYTANTGTSVTFSAAPPVNSIVQMTGWNTNGVQQIQGSNVFNVQTAGVTIWNTGFTYTVGFLDVYVNGVKLASGYDYTATTGTSVQFTTAPAKNSLVTFEGWTQGSTLGQLATQRKAFYVASAGQTTFASQGPYVPPYVDMYVNGIKLILNTDYTATDGATVVTTQGLAAGSNVEIVSSMSFAIGDVIRRTGDIFTGNVGIGTSAATSAFVVVGPSSFYGNINLYGSEIVSAGGLNVGNNFVVTGISRLGGNVTLGGALVFADGSVQNTSSINQLQVLNDISTAFDGRTTNFNLAVGSSNINIATPQQLLVSVGGAVLAPFITNPDYIDLSEVTLFTRGYKLINGKQIIFANAPRWQQDFSGRIISNAAPVGNTVTYPFKPLNIAMADG